MNPTSGGLLWKLQKKWHFLGPLVSGQAPDFVVERRLPGELDHIPVITFHVAIPERFEEQCAYLANNGYCTLNGEELKQIINGDLTPRPRSIAVTFDDGLKQVWTVAYPILRKYGLKAMVFLVPGCIPDAESVPRKTLTDVWRGEATEEQVFGVWPDESPLATWSEIRAMHESGVVDFQSHSMWHSLVYTSEEIVDFGRPDYPTHYFGNVHVPLYQRDGRDVTSRDVLLGMPIYATAPRMQVNARYFDDQRLRDHCVELVACAGGKAFFHQPKWRRVLQDAVTSYRQANPVKDRLEQPQERDAAIRAELRMAIDAIENRLPGKKVEHLCFPWYKGAKFARDCAVDTGHELYFCDSAPGSYYNVPGSKEKRIARIDEMFLRRLPGTGRMSRLQVLKEAIGLLSLRKRMFPG